MIIHRKKRNVIRIHEKVIATKHSYSISGPVLICAAILFFTALVVSESFKETEFFSDRGLIIVFAAFFLTFTYGLVIFEYRRVNNSPYKKIIYDTKYKWFRVYYNSYYHIVRPTDIVRVKAINYYKYREDEEEKFFGALIITFVDYSKTKNRYKSIKIHCANPADARLLIDECIIEKLHDDYIKVEHSRRVAKIQSSRIKYQQPYELQKAKAKVVANAIKKDEEEDDEPSFNAWD